ncbi:Myb-DNA-bind-2 domain-containing protein [Favolaschia claudopus]|uniref:Myb-DNA-bind-2 domain-containing protein n=1 Tax=Favolaschia claudopus TaxID=2862362 RepID=A0AAW0DM68_9AGAR
MLNGGRNPFTEDDDSLLIKYLAKHNPGEKGRSGNVVYKTLAANEQNKWKWSSRHSWSGWRDRYVKNQAEFNRRIKAYQKKKGWPTENSGWINGTQKPKDSESDGEGVEHSKLKRKRASSADARKRVKHASDSDESVEEVTEAVKSTSRPRTHVPDIYPDIAELDRLPNDRAPTQAHPVSPIRRPAPRVKPPLRHDPDSDYFASIPPTPTTTTDARSRPPTTASESRASVTSNTSISLPSPKRPTRALPRILERPFRAFFAGTGGKSSDVDAVQKPFQVPRMRAGDNMESDPPVRRKKNTESSPSQGVAPRRPPPQVNAVASSSRVQLPPASSRRVALLQTEPQLSQTPHQRSFTRSPPQSRRSHHTDLPQSPLDWGSPIDGPTTSSPVDSVPSPLKSRLPRPSPPSSVRAVSSSRPNRDESTSRDNASRVLPRLTFTGGGFNSGGSLRNQDRSIGSVEEGSRSRRSRAASPRAENTHPPYRLPSPAPPRFTSSRLEPRSGTPLEKKSKRTQDALPLGYKRVPTSRLADDTRRHSFPLPALLPRIDFDRMQNSAGRPARPRQSLPPRAPSLRVREAAPRRHSLFSPRPRPGSVPAPTTVTPGPSSERDIAEQIGMQALDSMAKNHGFGLEVVRNVFARTNDLHKTDEVLHRMRRSAEAVGEAALRGADESPLPPSSPERSELRHHRRSSGMSALRSSPEHPEEPFELRHRRQHSGASAKTNATRDGSSHRKKRQQAEEFHPQPLDRDILAESEYSPPSHSRAAAFARMQKGRVTESPPRRGQQRPSGSRDAVGRSSSVRNARIHSNGRVATPPSPQFTTYAEGNVEELRDLERRDVSQAMLRAADVARYMVDGSLPPGSDG